MNIRTTLLAGCAGHSYEARAEAAAYRHCNTVWATKIREAAAAERTPGQAMGVLRSGMNAADRISYENCLRNTWDREYESARAMGRPCNIRVQESTDYAICYAEKLKAYGYQPRSSGDVHIYR